MNREKLSKKLISLSQKNIYYALGLPTLIFLRCISPFITQNGFFCYL